MPSFQEQLLKIARLSQEDPLAEIDTDLIDAPAEEAPASLMPAPAILFPWILAQLLVGAAGYMAYKVDLSYFFDDVYEKMTDTEKTAYNTKLRDDWKIYEADYVAGFGLTRTIGLATTLVGVAGAATAFVAPGLFPIFTYVSALGGFGVLY